MNGMTKRRIKGIAMLSIVMMSLCGCNSDNDNPSMPQLTDADWNEVYGAVFLNDECLKNASASFDAIPGSDSVKMVLSGVHPEDGIELNVATAIDANGDITFEGEQSIEHVRHLKVTGLYRSKESQAGTAGNTPMLQVRVAYTVPGEISPMACNIKFTEGKGFRYNRDLGTYPQAKPEASLRQDSCEFICESINSELARHIESVSFSFDANGQMSLAYSKSKSNEIVRTFRYWISGREGKENSIVLIDNASDFYDTILDVLIPDENQAVGDMPHNPTTKAASLLVHKDSKTNGTLEVAVVDDMHSGILPYLYNSLLTDRVWTDKEKDCFATMSRRAGELNLNKPSYAVCSWTFVGTKQ